LRLCREGARREIVAAFAALFIASFALHAWAGAGHYSSEQLEHGGVPVTAWQYAFTSQFWFESFQNWQSEFLAILAMVLLSVVLRQHGSPASKDVDRPHSETGSRVRNAGWVCVRWWPISYRREFCCSPTDEARK
jgi:hypothetical protein